MSAGLDVRQAIAEDFQPIMQLFQAAIAHMLKNGIDQWDELYPAAADIAAGEMYICMQGGEMASVFVLNRQADEQYADCDWQLDEQGSMVVHRLCVHPCCQGRGIGGGTVQALEQLARQKGARSIRLDAFSQNPAALRLYQRAGYSKTGVGNFRKGMFYVFEKELD